MSITTTLPVITDKYQTRYQVYVNENAVDDDEFYKSPTGGMLVSL